MHESRIYYDIDEASALVPRLEYLFADLARIQRKVNSLRDYAAKIGVRLDVGEIIENKPGRHPVRRQIKERIANLAREYSEKLSEIQAMGVVVDDLDHGIVNFYSWIGDNEIFLSWQYGEPEIGHWHAVTENSIARRPLKKLFAARPMEAVVH